MNEVRGYPNPNYTEDDLVKQQVPLDLNAEILMDDKEYRELVSKASAFDILTASIRCTGEVKEDVVRAITGTDDPKMENEAQKYERWWSEETNKTYKLQEQNRQLQEEIGELKRQIEQLTAEQAEDPENAEVDADGQA